MGFSFGAPRSASKSRRGSRGLQARSRILIACEGEKTEPNYIKELCKSLGISSAAVEVVGKECGSAPISIVQYAIKRVKESKEFDEIYCVFDRDRHASFDQAIDLARRTKGFASIVSYPCFEYWLFIHFKYSRAPYVARGTLSPGDVMVEALKSEWPAYQKGDQGCFAYLREKSKEKSLLDNAMRHAERARKDVERTGEPNPSTDMDKLVKRLKEVADQIA